MEIATSIEKIGEKNTLEQLEQLFNQGNAPDDKIFRIQQEIERVKRDVYIGHLMDTTGALQFAHDDELEHSALLFRDAAVKVKRKMRWKKVGCYLFIGGIVTAVLLAIVAVIVVLSVVFSKD
jgi:t-SNARE complex subunit (syntaxin)